MRLRAPGVWSIGVLLTLGLVGAAPPKAPAAPATCESVPPGKNQYRLAVGYAPSRGNTPIQRNVALAAARASAERQLSDQLCAVLPAEACARYRGYIQPWQPPGVYDPDTRQACATAVVDAWLLQPDALRREAEAAMSQLADGLGASLGKEGVQLGSLQRSDGCAVPELDPARMWVRSRLAAANVPVYGADAPADIPTLDLLATVAAGTVTLGATVHHADGRETGVDPVRFSAAAYAVPEASVCAAGLAGRQSPGVKLEIDTRGGALCDGQPFEPRLTVDVPSRVHVYSVAPDGSAWHVWPEPDGTGIVASTVSLGTSYATAPIVPGDELLVAIVMPAQAPFTALDGVSGFCRLAGPLTPARLPAGARVAPASWHIDTRPGACGPPVAGQPTVAELAAAFAAAPVCR
ncbi:MAG: hypothetical protein V4850_28695 [Myxococcota bacterium]